MRHVLIARVRSDGGAAQHKLLKVDPPVPVGVEGCKEPAEAHHRLECATLTPFRPRKVLLGEEALSSEGNHTEAKVMRELLRVITFPADNELKRSLSTEICLALSRLLRVRCGNILANSCAWMGLAEHRARHCWPVRRHTAVRIRAVEMAKREIAMKLECMIVHDYWSAALPKRDAALDTDRAAHPVRKKTLADENTAYG